MSLSKCKFLLDENVRHELYLFLRKEGMDVTIVPKGLKNGRVAQLSLKEERILITNDGDFAHLSSDSIHGVVWLRIPQNDVQELLRAFGRLLTHSHDFIGKLVIIKRDQVDTDELAKVQ